MRLADQIVEQLRNRVREGQWRAGERLPAERQLAEQLGISRPILREAIQTLVSQGLLTSRRGAGTFVQAPDRSFLLQDTFEPLATLLTRDPEYRYDVLEARQALESSTAWHAAIRATPADKDRIQQALDVMLRHQGSGNAELSARADAEFHLSIAQASHNVVLLRVMHSLFELVLSNVMHSRHTMFTLSAPDTLDPLTEQHQALTQAIVQGDADGARRLIGDHLDYVRDTVRRLDDDQARRDRYGRLPDEARVRPLIPEDTA